VTRGVRPEVVHPIATPTVAVVILLFLLTHSAAAQVPIWPVRGKPHTPEDFVLGPFLNLKTSVKRGPLQQRLQAAFPESFSARVNILWGPDDGWVSPGVFDWWAFRVEPEGLNWEAAQRMFSRLSDQLPVFEKSGERQICAVVGASRNLLGSHYGGLIDGHDVVFRVNRAPTAEFHRDVGVKTTHHVMWPTALGPEQADRRAVLLMNPVTLHTEDVFGKIVSLVEKDLPWEPSRVRIIHPEFIGYVHHNWMKGQGVFPSTGLVAMMIAVHVCDEVDVFGFGANAEGNWDRYYERHIEKPADLHPVDVEGRLRGELEEKGILKVFLGNRSENGVEFPGFETDESEHD
jgi:beta-galactoside alpha-2,3-sialyltransferase (sialyltransferase 4A)